MADVGVKIVLTEAKSVIVTWETLTTTNLTGTPVVSGRYPDKTAQATGTFGASASIALDGSNDGTNWFACTNATGSAIALTAATQGDLMVENPLYIRPILTNGDGSTDIDVVVHAAVHQ